jgi:hypothetical protein
LPWGDARDLNACEIVVTSQSETENWSSLNQVITAIYSSDLYHNAELGEDISKLSSVGFDRRHQ